jgi:hypothetical protein
MADTSFIAILLLEKNPAQARSTGDRANRMANDAEAKQMDGKDLMGHSSGADDTKQ